MATHPSAIKRAKQNEKRSFRNLHMKTTVKTAIKRVRLALEEKDADGAQKALHLAIPLIQKGRSKRTFHQNTSARKIARLTREVNAHKAPAQTNP